MRTKDIRILGFLDACEQIERVAADLYHFYADHFVSDREISQLFRKTALEEENHVRMVQMAKRMVDQIRGVNVDTRLGQAAATFITNHFEDVKKFPPALDQALQSSIRFEDKMSIFHSDNALLFTSNEVREIFTSLMKNDQEHVESLQRALSALQESSAV